MKLLSTIATLRNLLAAKVFLRGQNIERGLYRVLLAFFSQNPKSDSIRGGIVIAIGYLLYRINVIAVYRRNSPA